MIAHDARHLSARVFVLLLMFIGTEVKGQVPIGPRNLGLGNASVALQGLHSIGSNAAGIAQLEKPTLSAIYGEHFLNSGTRSFAGRFAVPIGFASLGAQVHQYDFGTHYHESTAGLTAAKLLSSTLALGLSASYHSITVPGEMKASNISLDIGIQYSINQFGNLGLSIKNVQDYISEHEYGEPAEISLGGAYQFSHQLLLATEISYFGENRTDLAVGLEYLPMNWLFLRGGLSLNPFMQYAGAGVDIKYFGINIATSYHSKLGYSPQVSIDYRF